MNLPKTLSLIVAAILITSCSTESSFKAKLVKTLNENPDIVFDTIKNNPDRFLTTVQTAAKDAKSKLDSQAKANEEKELENAIENPLKPKITKDDYFLGPKDAPITIVEYSDFQCPFCTRARNTVTELMNKYPGKIRFVYKHLPLSFHPQAMISAQYFEAIALQSQKKAFAFHDNVFENQAKLKSGETYLTTLAKELKVDIKKLKRDLDSKEILAKIEAHKDEAREFKIQGTPGFIINGIPVRGAYPAEFFEQLINKLVSKGKLVI